MQFCTSSNNQGEIWKPQEARERIYEVCARKVVPVQLFNDIAIPYLERIEACVAWDVLNSFTSAMKKLKPSVQFESNLKLGKFFTSQQVALPSPHDMMAAR